MFDNHVHTCFSCDSTMKPEDACKRAISLSLDGIAITDHLDYDYPGYEDEFMIDFYKYLNTLDRLRREYISQLHIIKGIEVGLQPHVIDNTLETIKRREFDFIIGSVHIIDGMDPYTGGFYNDRPKHITYLRYLEEIHEMIRRFSFFDVLGHIDYITRYACYDDRTLYYSDYSDVIDEIFKIVIDRCQGIELNTRSSVENNTCSFDLNLLSRYKELGGEIISIGSDAHSEDFIGYRFEYFTSKIKNAGFKYLAYYVNRKPIFFPII